MKHYIDFVSAVGFVVTTMGGLFVSIIILCWLWDKALTYSLMVFGESTTTWLDIMNEMRQSGRLRFQKKQGGDK